MKKTYPIVMSTDDNYVLQLCVVLNSLKRNKLKGKVNVYILFSELSRENIQLVKSLQKKDFNINFVNVSEQFKSAKLYSVENISVAMYYRFIIPKILSQYKKVLYLDCDVVCTKNIFNIFEEDINGYYIGAIEDIYLPNSNYINSGVLLFNIEMWNKEDLFQKCIDYVNNNPFLKCPDQDTINEICKTKIRFLSFKYNFQQFCCYYIEKIKLINFNLKEVACFHYLSSHKPWKFPNHPLCEKWWKEVYKLPNQIKREVIKTFKNEVCLEKPDSEYYKYYFASSFKKLFIKIKRKVKK